jgi:hypothetical protein
VTANGARTTRDDLGSRLVARYRDRPLHLLGTAGLAVSTAGVVILAYLAVIRLAGGAIGHRPLLILGALLVVTGVQLLSIGLLAELAVRLHEEERLGFDADAREVQDVLQ